MNTKKYAISLLSLLLGVLLLGTTEDPKFPLGTFSYIGNKNHVYDFREDFVDYMSELGYNTNIIELWNPGSSSYSNYEDLYDKLAAKDIDVIIMDKRWDNTNYSNPYPLSMGSYYKFYAVYTDETPVNIDDNYDSQFWYGSRSYNNILRIGNVDAFDNNYWVCDPSIQTTPGWAYGDQYYRWYDAPNTQTQIPTSIGGRINGEFAKEFYINKNLADSNNDNNYLYITFTFMMTEVDTGLPDHELLSFQIVHF